MKPNFFSMIGLSLDIIGVFLVSVEAIKIENILQFRNRFLHTVHKITIPRISKMIKKMPEISNDKLEEFRKDLEEVLLGSSINKIYLKFIKKIPGMSNDKFEKFKKVHLKRGHLGLSIIPNKILKGIYGLFYICLSSIDYGNELEKMPKKERIKKKLLTVVYVFSHLIVGVFVLYALHLILLYLDFDILNLAIKILRACGNWFMLQSNTMKTIFLILMIPLIVIVILIYIASFYFIFAIGEYAHFLINKLTRVPIAIVDFIHRRTPSGTVGIIGFLFLAVGFLLQFYGTYLNGKLK